LSINRLQFDSSERSGAIGPTLDIFLKKFKHRIVDAIDDATADALGLSRAILCNDVLSKLQQRLANNQQFYKELIKKTEEMLSSYQSMAETQTVIGCIFAEIGTKEVEEEAKKEFGELGIAHKHLGKEHSGMVTRLEESIRALKSHAEAAIPDVRQTLAKYLDAKYEYLSYCLRIKVGGMK
jgi:PRKCA-binding protein